MTEPVQLAKQTTDRLRSAIRNSSSSSSSSSLSSVRQRGLIYRDTQNNDYLYFIREGSLYTITGQLSLNSSKGSVAHQSYNLSNFVGRPLDEDGQTYYGMFYSTANGSCVARIKLSCVRSAGGSKYSANITIVEPVMNYDVSGAFTATFLDTTHDYSISTT